MKPIVLKIPKDFDIEKFKREWEEAVESGEGCKITIPCEFDKIEVVEEK